MYHVAMIIILDRDHNIAIDGVITLLEKNKLSVHRLETESECILSVQEKHTINVEEIEGIPGVKRVVQVPTEYKLVSRESQKEKSIVAVRSVRIGDVGLTIIAGPCSIESRSQILEIAEKVRDSGAVMLRGGAYKPRTSPYSFQGLGVEGLAYLKEAGEAFGLPVVSEIVSPSSADVMCEYVDMFQIGARNMQNFELLKLVATKKKPILLKRGISATIEESLMAAEYLMAHGASDVVLCERGIRTFEKFTRNSLDINSIPVFKQQTHLPILVDPSHATGIRDMVAAVSLASIAAGADGLIIEVHSDPDKALSDGAQSLYPQQFEKLMRDIDVLSPVVDREVFSLHSLSVESLRHTSVADDKLVAFQGEHGSFSEQAVRRYFQKNDIQAISCKNFRDVFFKLIDNEVQYALIPIENSLMGSIHQNYDNLLHFPDIHIVGEIYIRIEHSLIGMPGTEISDISTVFSQPPGLEQCKKFLDEHPEWDIRPFRDTAGSVIHVAEQGKKENVAIAHHTAASIHGMTVIKQGIEDNPRNYTRFLALSKQNNSKQDINKASIVFSTADTPGSLFHCLRSMAERSLNMKKLESRPIHGRPWQYMFYLDVEIPENTLDVFHKAMEEFQTGTDTCRILGIYAADSLP